MQRKFKSSDPPYEIPFRILTDDMFVLKCGRPLNRKIALLAKARRITSPARKARQPSDDALMQSGPRLRKFCNIKIADLLIAKFSAYATSVRCYDRTGLALNLLLSRCILR